MLLNNRTFDKRFLKSYGDLMFAGKYIGDDIFGFGTKINANDNRFQTYILEYTLKKVVTKDITKVAKLSTNGTTSEAAAKEFLIQE